MKICLDFDKTVFDTVGFIEEMPVEPDLFKKTFGKAYLSGNYSVRKHPERLAEEGVEVDKSQIREVFDSAPEYLSTRSLGVWDPNMRCIWLRALMRKAGSRRKYELQALNSTSEIFS